MLASQTTEKVTVAGEEYGIRKLSWRTLDRAQKERQVAQAQAMRAYGGDVLKGLRGDAMDEAARQLKAEKEDLEAQRKARYDAYDRGVVLSVGVTSTPYTGDVQKVVDELDEQTSKELHEKILDLSLPALDPAKAAAAGKGDSGASISS